MTSIKCNIGYRDNCVNADIVDQPSAHAHLSVHYYLNMVERTLNKQITKQNIIFITEANAWLFEFGPRSGPGNNAGVYRMDAVLYLYSFYIINELRKPYSHTFTIHMQTTFGSLYMTG